MSCRGGTTSLINIQLAVISLHRMLTEVSELMLIDLAIYQLTNNPSAKSTNQSEFLKKGKANLLTHSTH